MTGDPQTSPETAAQTGREFAPDPREVDEFSLRPLVRSSVWLVWKAPRLLRVQATAAKLSRR